MSVEFLSSLFSDNQSNDVLIGKIIDKVAGITFSPFIKTHEFEPAGATHLVLWFLAMPAMLSRDACAPTVMQMAP